MLDKNCNVVRGWRRAVMEDFAAIEDLTAVCGYNTTSLYNSPAIDHLIEKSYFPIVQLDEAGKILSFTAYMSYPNIPSVPSFCWMEWIQEKYKLEDVNSRNSLFIHYMVWHPIQNKDFLQLLLETTFLEFPHLRYIILVKPPLVRTPELYMEYFIPTLPCNLRDENDVYSVQSINVCHRHSLIEPLRIRRAVAEDSDILMSLMREKEFHDLEKLYGEYFSSQLFQFPGVCERHALVCEYEGIAAGFFSVNLCVNLDVLEGEFELIPFNGLRKTIGSDVLSGDLTPESEDFADKCISQMLYKHGQDLVDESSLTSESLITEFKGEESSSSSESVYDMDLSVIDETPSALSEEVIKSVERLPRSENLVPAPGPENKNNRITVDGSLNDGIQALRTKDLLAMPSERELFLPRYNGPPNAFAIEIFAVDNDKINERLSVDFLEAAFALAPDRDYCILTIPTHLLPIPLLNHFIRVNHKPTRQMRHELYVCHKSYFSSSVFVKPTESSDLEEIEVFLRKIYNGRVVYEEFRDSLKPGSTNHGYALVVGKRIVGLALLSFEMFSVDPQLYFDFAGFSVLDLHDIDSRSILKHLLLIPPFHAFGRFFLSDVMRLADVTCFFHPLLQGTKLSGSIASLLGELIPLKPRKSIRPGSGSLVSPDVISKLLNFDVPFSLFFTNSQICNRLKLNINKIIVVIGASMTATSFFENIIFGSSRSHFLYNNLIWISAHGTEHDLPENKVRDLLFPVRNKYDRNYRAMLSLRTHVHFIHGVMTGINRDEKYVIIDRSAVVKYDVLILTLGLQFLCPVPEVKQKSSNGRRKAFPRSSLSRFLSKATVETDSEESTTPVNMMLINTYLEAENAMSALKYTMNQMTSWSDKKIIVYGHNIRVFLLLHALLKLGIPGEKIVFVEPFPSREVSVTVFGDVSIDREVINTIKKYRIQYYPEYFLYDWALTASNRIATITFHSTNAQVTLQCLVFIPLVCKLVSDINFNACNDAGLVYDGKLVIDSNFKTNDANVFAAGPFTKYPRRFCNQDSSNQYYSSAEVGQKLAENVRQEIDPLIMEPDEECGVDVQPRFEQPVMMYCQLPGDFYYFSLQRPGKPVDLESAFNHRLIGDVLVTGDCQMSRGRGYFKLQLDEAGCVRGITCFSNREIDYMNLYSLYGLNEKLLNNLLARHDCGMISDFYEYFRQPWADAIFHRQFSSLTKYNLERLKENINIPAESKLSLQFSEGTKKKIELGYKNSSVKAEIQRNVLEFVNYFDKDLPRYATRNILRELLPRDETPEDEDVK